MKIRKPQEQKTLDPGTELFSIATGRIDIMRRDSRKASDFICKQEGFLAVYPTPNHTLWFFDTVNHAKAARNMIRAKGAETGDNICKFIISADGRPEPCSKVKEEFVVG
jgi:hypothetical protein